MEVWVACSFRIVSLSFRNIGLLTWHSRCVGSKDGVRVRGIKFAETMTTSKKKKKLETKNLCSKAGKSLICLSLEKAWL